MDYWYCLCVLLLVHMSSAQPHTNLPDVDRRIYEQINGTAPCVRHANATHVIGCSASAFGQRAFIQYVPHDCNFDRLLNSGPLSPYIAILEHECFTPYHIHLLKNSTTVLGVVFRAENITNEALPDTAYSPERSCPNNGFENECSRPWNPYASSLLFQDFGDFPIIAVPSDQFQVMLECYETHNANITTGSFDEYPLCFAEVIADMYLSMDTPTCKRREHLPVNYLGSISFCQNLGDYNIWGSPFNLVDKQNDRMIMVAAKMDSVSFLLTNYSIGAQSEVAGIVTLLAIIDQIGRLRQNGLSGTANASIMYTFFNGETWDYIGSSSMVYDMINGKFPYDKSTVKGQTPPGINISNISSIIELSQLGFPASTDNTTLFLHGGNETDLFYNTLKQKLSNENITLSLSGNRPRGELPPASLQSFLREGIQGGYILAGFNDEFNNQFFGSRYDNVDNLVRNSSLTLVAEKLAHIATALTKVVLKEAGATCNSGSSNCVDSASANSTLIQELLTCFLVNSGCPLFSDVAIYERYRQVLVPNAPLNRYVSVSAPNSDDGPFTRGYTSVIFQLIAKFSSFNSTIMGCDACQKLIDMQRTADANLRDWVTNLTRIQIDGTPNCYCVQSYTYTHRAESPALKNGDAQNPASTKYSTWTESRWNIVGIRIYLVAHSGVEAGALLGGLAMTLLTLLLAIQCSRRADKLFQSPVHYDLYHVS